MLVVDLGKWMNKILIDSGVNLSGVIRIRHSKFLFVGVLEVG